MEFAAIQRLGHQSSARAQAGDPAVLALLAKTRTPSSSASWAHTPVGRLALGDRVERHAAADGFERGAGLEQAFHLAREADQFGAHMAGEGFGFAQLLGQDGIVGELALFERLERQGAAERQHQEAEHADGNRTTRLFRRRLVRLPTLGRPRPQCDSFRSRTDSPVLESETLRKG